MGLFDFFKKKEVELNNEEQQWNKMWDLWADGEADSPYAELMTYQSEINNGGHDQYFTNIENTGDLQKEMSALMDVLPDILKENLLKARETYLLLEENEANEQAEEIMEQCDDAFYENEEQINRILENYADKMKL